MNDAEAHTFRFPRKIDNTVALIGQFDHLHGHILLAQPENLETRRRRLARFAPLVHQAGQKVTLGLIINNERRVGEKG